MTLCRRGRSVLVLTLVFGVTVVSAFPMKSRGEQIFDGRAAMRWYVSIGVVLVAGVLAGGDVAGFAAPYQTNRPGHQPNAASRQLADKEANPTVDVELVLAVDVSYSMDMDELALQREGYAQAIVSKEFLQALKSGPNGKIMVTYFEWAASTDQKIMIPW